MGSAGLQWDVADIIAASRMNQKDRFVGTGAQIAGLAATYPGQEAYCTSTGSGFIIDHLYERNAANSAWNDMSTFLPVAISTSQVVDIYDTTLSDYSIPSSATASSYQSSTSTLTDTNNYQASTAVFYSDVWVTKFTGLTPGDSITKVSVKVNVAAGNIRVKVYKDDGSGGGPGTLLGESGSNAISGTGQQDYSVSATIPPSGNVWAGFEVDSSSASLYYSATGGPGSDIITHTYGSGPSPFGTITTNTGTPWTMITYTHTISYPASNVYDNNTATEWISTSSVNPNIYVDMGSAQLLTGAAVYWDGTNTTSTQILVQTSPDGITWTTVRTINTNLFTTGAWNYFRWQLPNTALPRYVRFYANDGGAVVLAIWEIRIKAPSAGLLAQVHGHAVISSSVATTPLNS